MCLLPQIAAVLLAVTCLVSADGGYGHGPAGGYGGGGFGGGFGGGYGGGYGGPVRLLHYFYSYLPVLQ